VSGNKAAKEKSAMFYKKTLASLILAAAVLAPAASFAAPAEKAPCILSAHRITSVTPYRVQQHAGRGVTTRLAGAQVFVQAEPGLTPEWLELQLARHITEMKAPAGMPNCALGVKDVSVKVDSAGTGFAVKLIARDSSQAEEVLRRAQLLAR
jgi:hypothetical protein